MPKIKRCHWVHPNLKYDNGRRVRCSLLAGHAGPHWDTFANRKWSQ